SKNLILLFPPDFLPCRRGSGAAPQCIDGGASSPCRLLKALQPLSSDLFSRGRAHIDRHFGFGGTRHTIPIAVHPDFINSLADIHRCVWPRTSIPLLCLILHFK